MADLRPARHHWWPSSLSQFWTVADGTIGCIRPDGSGFRTTPESLANIRDGHTVRMVPSDSPLNFSFEAEFQRTDDRFPDLVDYLHSLECIAGRIDKPINDRLEEAAINEGIFEALKHCLVSLAVRSPAGRHLHALGAAEFRGEDVVTVSHVDPVIGLNMRGKLQRISERLAGNGKVAVVLSDTDEFVFGDGFLNNIGSDHIFVGARCIVPLTPTMAVVFATYSSCAAEPNCFTLRASREEIGLINLLVQAYSSQFLFYRSQAPLLSESFKAGRHQMLKYHQHPWLSALIDAMSGLPPRSDAGLLARFLDEPE